MSSNPREQKPERINGQSSVQVKLVYQPDECPICHVKINPIFRISAFIHTEKIINAVFQCTNEECQKLFISKYTNNDSGQVYYYTESIPDQPLERQFSEEISTISPTFCAIYNQVIYAESQKLDLITGIGLRKAIEYLVKDFLIYKFPEKKEAIKMSFLSKCIEDYIDNLNIKNCIKRATWLANDETHYIRKWDQHDISDLKMLIRLSLNWIENEILTQKYMEEMKE